MNTQNMDLDIIAANIVTEVSPPIGNGGPAGLEKNVEAEKSQGATTEDTPMIQPDATQIAAHTAKDDLITNGKLQSAEKELATENIDPPATTDDTPMSEQESRDRNPSPPLTHALEALLGGLDNPSNPVEETVAPATLQPLESSTSIPDTQNVSVKPAQASASNADPTAVLDKQRETTTPALITVDQPTTDSIIAQTSGENGQPPNSEPAALEEESQEWEMDSSPIESSSDDSSSDDSSDESEDGDNAYKLLSPEEQARILMEGDGGSDDEGNKAKGAGAQLRTKNEIPEVVIPKPDVTITEDMTITELGAVEAIVENIVLVKAKISGEYRVLESASVLCLADRSVIGVVSETLGRIAEAKLELGTKVFYAEQHSTYVFTQALKAYKGSDASNLHDEEVGDEEMEFSDDEAEMEHKRRVKQAKRGRGGKSQQNGGSSRGGHPLQQHQTPYDASRGLDYDDADDDGPYKPLSRPVGYADSIGRSEAPEEGAYQGGPNGNTHNQNRDTSRGRGRGDRGRGRGDRGRGDRVRGRGGYQDRRGGSSGHSLPPQGRPNYPQPPPNPSPGQNFTPQFQPQGRGFHLPAQTSPSVPPTGYNNAAYSPHQPQLPAWPFPPPPQYQQPFTNMPNMPNMPNMWPTMPPQAPLHSGAFINPAFFGHAQGGAPNQWNPQGQQDGRGRGGS
ncbi:H/ACA ribonucleoprotein complex non-core subunit [Lachnellula hyalina]|uniref:H/ACA ribonucleoprotein complex non-core subunit n=1 Tax=Lachnellula hyalina TaxID=1316788 RepID=A0A8H8QY70_9HELO|nr:H/ACA ribonucleoprotein complex non-core subunit [Lachnellula hyalina]TVY24918.1 H/ACA ribonucleoprotein complex non-core subunit [Lachnellula hyalina]